MLSWFLAAHAAEPVIWDVLPENTAAAALADEYGFKTVRRLTRMSLALEAGAAPLRDEFRAGIRDRRIRVRVEILSISACV